MAIVRQSGWPAAPPCYNAGVNILGIETSCDETAIALLAVKNRSVRILKNRVYSQEKIHAKTGGVVPEVAARNHVVKIVPLLQGISKRDVDLIAVTRGPGLAPALSVGVEVAKTLSWLWQKPLVGTNHLEGHIASLFLEHWREITFPALALIVSGGHSDLAVVRRPGNYKKIGETLDDAAGEAFDKVARLLRLGYPGGPAVERVATNGNPIAIDFPRPLLKSNDAHFSFAGLKTAVLYHLQKYPVRSARQRADIAASFQAAVCDVLVGKTLATATRHRAKSILVSGGVSANGALHRQFRETSGVPIFFPRPVFATDNAAMIALAGYFRRSIASRTVWQRLTIDPNLSL